MAYRRLAVGVSALAISIGPAGLWTAQGTAGAAAGDPYTCRASAVRVDPTLPAPLADLPTVEPFVANGNNNPCTTQDTGLVKKTQLPLGLGNAAVLFANTQNGPGSTAQAGVADVTITVPNAPVIRAEVLTSRANAGACTAGDTTAPKLTGESTVARVTVGSTVIEPVKGPQVVDLGPAGKLFLNQQTFSAADGATANNTVTQRALFLDTPVADVVIAEAIADFRGNPCDPGTTGGGGGGGGTKPECSDGVDNDGDGRVDFPADPGCTGPEDNDEKNNGNGGGGGPKPQCSDGVDNDGDGRVDFPADPGCTGPEDNDEKDNGGGGTRPQCDDGIDNDGDGRVDFPADPGCTNTEDNDESDNGNNVPPRTDNPPDCSDELDNDGDGLADWPNDPGCASPQDDDETNNSAPQCSDGKDNDGDGRVDYPSDPGCTDRTDGDERDDRPECSDGADNDRDGTSDFPADTGCKSATDDDEAAGFITGGGGYDELDKKGLPEDTVNPGERLRFGTVLPCDLGDNPGPNLITSWFGEGSDDSGNGVLMQFKLEALTRAFCRNDPHVDPRNPNTEFDTYVGEGTGTLRVAGAELPARAEWVLVDRGEPGSPPGVGIDYYEIRVYVGAVMIANGCCTLDQGNVQAHTPGGGQQPAPTGGGKKK